MSLNRHHPVRVLLEQAALGHMPTRAQLDQLEAMSAELPDGQSFTTIRARVAAGAADCQRIAASGDRGAARRRADDIADDLATGMTPEQRAIDRLELNPEPLEDIASRMFSL